MATAVVESSAADVTRLSEQLRQGLLVQQINCLQSLSVDTSGQTLLS